MKDNFIGQICKDIFTQILDLFIENDKKLEIKKRLIDPLIDYYKNKLFIYYGIITFLLILVILTNLYIIFKIHKFLWLLQKSSNKTNFWKSSNITNFLK